MRFFEGEVVKMRKNLVQADEELHQTRRKVKGMESGEEVVTSLLKPQF
jgi:hypothetical protein